MTCLSLVSRFRCTFAMTMRPLARDELWDIAITQHGFVTAQQATELGVGKGALQMLVARGTLTCATHGGSTGSRNIRSASTTDTCSRCCGRVRRSRA